MYPVKGGVLRPSHGDGPRCKVHYDPKDDGPLTTVQIMRIDDDGVEDYSCAMPRYYAIPLILINKQLTFYEAQCHPDGTWLPPSSSCGIKQRDLREYSYFWRLRECFLEAVFDMNHDRILNERWRYDGIHGFLHRMYRRFGHDEPQRIAYWREEIKEGRVPYAAPDIARMGESVHPECPSALDFFIPRTASIYTSFFRFVSSRSPSSASPPPLFFFPYMTPSTVTSTEPFRLINYILTVISFGGVPIIPF
jgi:hypothetical protein